VASQQGVDQEADQEVEEGEGHEAGAWHLWRGASAAEPGWADWLDVAGQASPGDAAGGGHNSARGSRARTFHEYDKRPRNVNPSFLTAHAQRLWDYLTR